jgi:hypothetical protein
MWAQRHAQYPNIPSQTAGPDFGFAQPVVTEGGVNGQMSHLEKKLNQDRQLALKRDTDKLLELASQLKQNVDRTNANILSMDVVKKAQEIEKLAKSVKEKMKGD